MAEPHYPAASIDVERRRLFGDFSIGAAAALAAGTSLGSGTADAAMRSSIAGFLDAKSDFGARGDGEANDTRALQNAIDFGSANHRPIVVPLGVYRITKPLSAPSNTMLIGSSPGLGFGCRIEPYGCPALEVGGEKTSFHCYFENLMIWPKGPAPQHIVSIDNSYSVTFRNIRIHDAQQELKGGVVKLLGDRKAGGHGQCNGIIWDNLIVRNDTGQPPLALLAASGCGSHRFFTPCLENFAVLLQWNGGQLDLFAPYTERAGRYGIDCDVSPDDATAYLNTFGGFVNSAESGTGCAIRSTTAAFNSFGTQWGNVGTSGVSVYSVPPRPARFHGVSPNVSGRGKGQFTGSGDWLKGVSFPDASLRGAKAWKTSIAAGGRDTMTLRVAGVHAGIHWVRASMNCDTGGASLDAYVTQQDEVTVTARNPGRTAIDLDGTMLVDCGWPA